MELKNKKPKDENDINTSSSSLSLDETQPPHDDASSKYQNNFH